MNLYRHTKLATGLLALLGLLFLPSITFAQFDKVTDQLEGKLNDYREVIVIVDVVAVVDGKGREVASQYRGDLLKFKQKLDGKVELSHPHGWVNAKDVLEIEGALKSLTGRTRGRSNPNLIINRALVNHALGESKKGIDSLNQLLNKNPDNTAAKLAKVKIQLSWDDYVLEKLSSDLVDVYRKEPTNIQAFSLLIESHKLLGAHPETLKLFAETKIPVSQHADLLIEKGFAQWYADEYEDSLKSLNTAIELETTRATAWVYRGNTFVSLGNDKKAIADFTHALKLDPSSSDAYYYRGDVYDRNDEIEKAITDYSASLNLSDGSADIYTARGDLYRKIRVFDKAMDDFDQALQLDPEGDFVARLYFLRALTFDDLGKNDLAFKSYAEALKRNPKLIGPHRERARLYSDIGEWNKAEADLKVALEIDADDELAWRFLGDLYRLNDRYRDSVTAYDKAVKIDANDSTSWNNRAISLTRIRKYTEAIASYEKAIQLAPKDALYRTNIAAAYRRMDKFNEAASHLTEAIEFSQKASIKDRAYLWLKRGDIYRFDGELKKAIADLDQAIQLDDKYADAYNSRGICQEYLKNYKAAIQDYDQAIQLKPGNFIMHLNRGDAYKKSGEAKKAYDDYSEAIKLNPKSAMSFIQRGKLLVDNGEYEVAIDDLEQARKLEPDNMKGMIDLGDSYRYSKKYEKAIVIFSQLLAKNPNSSFSLFARADCYRKLGRLAEAEAGFRSALSLDKKSAISWVGLGELYEEDDRYKQAIEFYNKAIEISPKYEWALYRKGFSLSMLNKLEESQPFFTKVLELNPKHLNARLFRANGYRDLKQYTKAHQDYLRAIEVDKKYSFIYLGRARCWKDQQNYVQAVADYSHLLELDNPSAGEYNERARLLASVTDPNVFNPKQALIDARKCCELSQNSNAAYLDTLAVAFAANGQFAEAIQTQQNVISLSQKNKLSKNFLEAANSRLDLYRNNKPFVSATISKNEQGSVPVKSKSKSGGLGSGAGRLFGN